MKGIELPINILVIVAVAIIVLLGVIALFYSSWFTGTGPVSSQSAITEACSQASRQTCTGATPLTYTVNSYKSYTNLAVFCVKEYATAGWTDSDPVAGDVTWLASAADARKCLNLACGMGC